MLTRRSVLAGLSGLFIPVQVSAQAADVSMALVLAVDISSSIDNDHFWLQRKGYIEALTNPDVLRAVRESPKGRIAVTYFEWSGYANQSLLVPWRLWGSEEDGDEIAAILNERPRPFEGPTAVGAAMDFGLLQLQTCPFQTEAKVIDMSGDGGNNDGIDPALSRERATTAGVSVNGLSIDWARSHPPAGMTIEQYYNEAVKVGPRSFVMPALGFDTFAYALAAKMRQEVADAGGSRFA